MTERDNSASAHCIDIHLYPESWYKYFSYLALSDVKYSFV